MTSVPHSHSLFSFHILEDLAPYPPGIGPKPLVERINRMLTDRRPRFVQWLIGAAGVPLP